MTRHDSSDKPTVYQFSNGHEGTLDDAIEAAQAEDETIELTDAAGFVRGWVYPNGDWRLI